MNKKNIIIAAVGIVGLSSAYYFGYYDTKKRYATIVKTKSQVSGSIEKLMSFDKQFLKEWAKALQKGLSEFVYSGNGLRIDTRGGSTIK